MSRRIFMDTEFGGPQDNERIIEIGMVEVVNGKPTGREYTSRFNPEGAEITWYQRRVHGIYNYQLANKPLFRDRFMQIMRFIDGATVYMHGAENDLRVLDNEMRLMGRGEFPRRRVVDTYGLFKRLMDGQKCGLDALIEREGLPARKNHGALSDARILAQIFGRHFPETEERVKTMMTIIDRRRALRIQEERAARKMAKDPVDSGPSF